MLDVPEVLEVSRLLQQPLLLLQLQYFSRGAVRAFAGFAVRCNYLPLLLALEGLENCMLPGLQFAEVVLPNLVEVLHFSLVSCRN